MRQRGPWTHHSTSPLLERRFFTAMSDQVTTPTGTEGLYDWIQAPDLVRVAAVSGDSIYIVEQHHYLPDQVLWQLPGGNIDPGEDPDTAVARELSEEVGATAASWRGFGAVLPMPGLTPARVHLFSAEDLHLGDAHPDDTETDLTAKPVPLDIAVQAALDGRIGCAASAQLVLAVAATQTTPTPTTP